MILLLTAVTLLPGAIVIVLVLARRQRETRLAAHIAFLRQSRRSADIVWLRARQPERRARPAAIVRTRRRRASSA